MPPAKDLTNSVFHDLTVLGFAEYRYRGKRRERYWRCQCHCGRVIIALGTRVATGRLKSCGCRRASHGLSASPRRRHATEYRVFMNMWTRCTNTTREKWHHYGGRGITICERWKNFDAFLTDMGPRPSRKHSIERRNNDGNYCPENCYWGTATDQSRNNRNTHPITFQGKTQPISVWAEELGVSYASLIKAIARGYPIASYLEMQKNKTALLLSYHGVTQPLFVWANVLQVTYHALYKAIQRGHTIESFIDYRAKRGSLLYQDTE